MENTAICIKHVENRSLAKKAGIRAGDFLLSINGVVVKDIFDYQYHSSNDTVKLEIMSKESCEAYEVIIEKDPDEDLGIVFEKDLIDDEKSCHNKCIFCFIDQLPEGMRDTLYFKDDDARLSFLTGNYVTLTNMSYEDIQRIADMHFSPVNVSVHATDSALRCSMLNNRFAGDVLDKMRIFADAGIELNAQIVLCKGINDKAALDKTIQDLAALSDNVQSISVVPVGITKFREGLHPLEPFSKQDCLEVIEQIETMQQQFKKQRGSSFVYAADEFYINAQRELPDVEKYDGFPQIENGVGLMANFLYEANEYIDTLKKESFIKRKLNERKSKSIATGMLAYPFIQALVDKVSEISSVNIKVYPITNEFFGDSITVSGLLTGSDLVKSLSNERLGSRLLISKTMLKADEDIFLDNMTLNQLSKKLNTVVRAVENNGASFIQALIK